MGRGAPFLPSSSFPSTTPSLLTYLSSLPFLLSSPICSFFTCSFSFLILLSLRLSLSSSSPSIHLLLHPLTYSLSIPSTFPPFLFPYFAIPLIILFCPSSPSLLYLPPYPLILALFPPTFPPYFPYLFPPPSPFILPTPSLPPYRLSFPIHPLTLSPHYLLPLP